jgi:hypothetical protein
MPRVPKAIAQELILLVKKIELKANTWDPKATSAFEFARQMLSPKLRKINPKMEVALIRHELPDEASIFVEYVDGSKWEQNTGNNLLCSYFNVVHKYMINKYIYVYIYICIYVCLHTYE